MTPTREELAAALAALVDAVDGNKPGKLVSALVRARCLVDRMRDETAVSDEGSPAWESRHAKPIGHTLAGTVYDDGLTFDDVWPKHPDSR